MVKELEGEEREMFLTALFALVGKGLRRKELAELWHMPERVANEIWWNVQEGILKELHESIQERRKMRKLFKTPKELREDFWDELEARLEKRTADTVGEPLREKRLRRVEKFIKEERRLMQEKLDD